jgi:adenylosuccinate synthase
MLNNFSSLNITKLDVLDHLDEIKIGVKYKLNGEEIKYMPSTIEEFS